jgi:hypothetical protein
LTIEQALLVALLVFLDQPLLGFFNRTGKMYASPEQLRHCPLQPAQTHHDPRSIRYAFSLVAAAISLALLTAGVVISVFVASTMTMVTTSYCEQLANMTRVAQVNLV